MRKINKIKLIGVHLASRQRHLLKISEYSPIPMARSKFSVLPKEVRVMEAISFETHGNNMAEQIKSIRKVRLQREVLENPEVARELVKVEASGTYNAKGDVVQAVATDLGDA